MKILSIDLEACNVYLKGSVFSIGVVLADENFNIIFKKNYIINPQCRFVMKFRKPIDFHLDKDFIMSQPTISEQYKEIAALFTPDSIVVAHSAMNDVLMLNAALRRARLAPINYKFICSQLIYSAVHNLQNGIGLDKVAEELHIEFQHHTADDDAFIALQIVKHEAEANNTDCLGLLKLLGITPGKVQNFSITPIRCKVLTQQKIERKKEKIEKKKHLTAESKQPGAIRMRLDAIFFEQIVVGHKTVEVRLNDTKRKKLNEGDIVYFVKNSSNPDIVKVKITRKVVFSSFQDIYDAYGPVVLGVKCDSAEEYATYMHLIYTYDDLAKFQAVALEIELID